MGLAEHYAIDLVVALPFTAAVCATKLRCPGLAHLQAERSDAPVSSVLAGSEEDRIAD